MAKERGHLITISEGSRGEDTETWIRKALDHEDVLKWAYILHDQDVYTEFDMGSRRNELSYRLADGYDWSERYSSVEEYYEEEMKKPPHIGDPKKPLWLIVCITDSTCSAETVAGRFGFDHPAMIQRVADREDIAAQIQKLTQEDRFSVNAGMHRYADDEVKANFDFRSYIRNTKQMNPALKKMRDLIVPVRKKDQ